MKNLAFNKFLNDDTLYFLGRRRDNIAKIHDVYILKYLLSYKLCDSHEFAMSIVSCALLNLLYRS